MAVNIDKIIFTIDWERKKQGLTIQDLADRAKISAHAYHEWRSGKAFPRLCNFIDVIDALGLDMKIVRKKGTENE